MRALGIAAALIVTGQVLAASDLVIPLKFIPTTKPGEVTAQLREGMSSRSIAIEVEDARGMKSVDLVGEGTADNDSMFRIRATGHVPSFVKATLKDRLSAWGAVVEDKSQLVLAIRASRFFVRESNMVFGSASRRAANTTRRTAARSCPTPSSRPRPNSRTTPRSKRPGSPRSRRRRKRRPSPPRGTRPPRVRARPRPTS